MNTQAPPVFGPAEIANAEALIAMAIAEDLGNGGDITSSATIPAGAVGSAAFRFRQPGVVAGLPILRLLAKRFVMAEVRDVGLSDGAAVEAGQIVATIAGSVPTILAMERISLNFLQRLSGIATLTARFVAQVEGTKAVILDTRKTLPGWRVLEKYAVRCGGGRNHRMGLHDAVLIKDNHLAALASEPDPIGRAVAAARAAAPHAKFVEVEVDDLDQFDRALACDVDIILIDNLGPDALAEAVRRRDASRSLALLEASGGITLGTVAAVARSGVDRISVGAITHSAPAHDVGLDYKENMGA